MLNSIVFYLDFPSCDTHNSQDSRGSERLFLTHRFHPLHEHLKISQLITTETLPLHIASGRTGRYVPLMLRPKIPISGKCGQKNQNSQYKMKFGTYTNLNMLNSEVTFIFPAFLGKFGRKNWNCLFKMKLGL